MKTRLLALLTIMLVGITSCYDDTALQAQLAEHEQRIQTLETLCAQLNTNITSLQTIVEALQKNDNVASVAPIKQGEKEIGYTITFVSGKTITVYHGEDGSTPQIGVKKDTDGVYYWTLDGAWLTDDDGKKIPASGENGEISAAVPQIKVQDGYWYVSYDNGKTWDILCEIIGGENTAGSATCIFQKVSQTNDSVVLTLSDGTTITLPKVNAFNVIFAQTKDILAEDGETLIIPFKVEGATAEVTVECMVSEESIRASAYMTSATEGEVKVKINWFSYYTDSKVVVFVSNGNQQVIVKALTFEEKQLKAVQDAYELPCDGGTFEVELTTNMEYDVIIPDEAQSWISLVETKAVRTDVLEFEVKPISEGMRNTDILIKSKDETISQIITVVQQAIIKFADPVIEKQCLEAFDTNNDGRLSCAEAASVTDLSKMVLSDKSFVSFNELQYFTSIKEIPYFYFSHCYNLKEISIPSSVETIGDDAFGSCSGLTSIEIPSSVTTIGDGAFHWCDGLTSIEIPSSVETIGDDAFWSCSGLTSIEIPSSVTTIGSRAFSSCSGLTSIEIPSSVTTIGDNAFWSCSGLTSIEIPSSVTTIGGRAFGACSGLTSIVVSSGNTVYDSRENSNSIIETATNTLIQGCSNSFIPSSVTTIGNYAFEVCSGLTSIEIPSSVETIGDSAFYNCSGLTSIEIPSSVTTIGDSAFGGCSGLTSIEIPSSVTTIGDYPFDGCDGLTSIVVSSGNTVYDSRENSNTIIETATNTLIQGCGNSFIPSSVTTIGGRAFFGCSGLTSIEIPSSVETIGDSAFYWCSGLTSIEIPSSVTTIGNFAFSGCSGLTSIEIPSSVTSIGVSAFYGCNNLLDVYMEPLTPPLYDNKFSVFPFTGTSVIKIYVPHESVDLYKEWCNGEYASLIVGYQF